MARLTPKMSLNVWDKFLDLYNYLQLGQNWQKIDLHDHTLGKGAQIPMGGLAPGSVGPAQLSSDLQADLIQTGMIFLWPITTVPSGYLACDGAAYDQAAYIDLYNVVGTLYHTTAGAGKFNVPFLWLSGPVYGQLQFIIKT